MSQEITRRQVLEFFGKSTAGLALAGLVPSLTSCTGPEKKVLAPVRAKPPFEPALVSTADSLNVASGFQMNVLAKYDDVLNKKGERFGTNNDYLAYFRLNPEGTDAILWVNHESLHPLLVSGYASGGKRTREQVEKEMLTVGGSLVRIQQKEGKWALVANDKHNRRLHAKTKIPFASARPIMGAKSAMGTMANCAGGVTPWGTVLTCEENYENFYGEAHVDASGKRTLERSMYGWEDFHANPPEHYGWVVEVEPRTGKAKKLVSLGRFAHECATVRLAADGRAVVYSGDDANDERLYKFIADKPKSLETGTLYVADTIGGRWLPLTMEKQKAFATVFKDQTDVLIRCREAARIAGGTPLNRPEDIEIDPVSGAVFVALTNNRPKGDHFGSILKIEEMNGDPLALEFKASTLIAGGVENGFACPDNMVFDRKGNLWFTTDISGSAMGKAPYESFGHNALLYMPFSGENAGRAFRVATAPTDAELTGPCFSHDGRTLFLSVQHPGEMSKSLDQLTSHWPDGGDTLPRSSVVTITGPTLEKLVEGEAVKPVFEVPVI